MLATIQQPYFLPWLGFFAKLAQCDFYVALDDVHYRRNHLSRTQVRRPDGVRSFISLAIGASQNHKMNEIPVRLTREQILVLLDKIRGYYSKAECFAEEMPFVTNLLESIVTNETRCLSELNIALIWRVLLHLRLKEPKLFRSSQFSAPQERTERTVFLAKAAGASELLFGDGGSMFVHDVSMIANNVHLKMLSFMEHHPVYEQVSEPTKKDTFLSGCSVIDALLNVGRDTTRELIMAVKAIDVSKSPACEEVHLNSMEVRFLDRALAEQSLDQLQDLDFECVAAGDIEAWSDESFLLDLPDKWLLSVLVVDDQKIIAYSIISGRSRMGNYAHLHRIVVASTHRERGVGRFMLEYARKLAVAKGYLGMTSFVMPNNVRSLRFFNKLGFLEQAPFKHGSNISMAIRFGS